MQIAVQTALVVAKAARFDYPRDWPSLFNDLLGQVHGGDKLTVRRVYFVLHHVLKELSSKRLVADQKNFAEVGQAADQQTMPRWWFATTLLCTLCGRAPYLTSRLLYTM